jgi:hypothetical protein
VPRLRRFLHLERPRQERGAEPAAPDPGTAGRFGGVERPGDRPAPPEPRSSGAQLGRFGPEPERGLELAEAAPDRRPFTRCMACGMDHNLGATQCSTCGATLATDEVRAYNDRLWAERQEQAAREAAEGAALREARARAEAEYAEARRAMGEELARQVGDRERRRLDAELGELDWGPLRRLLGRALDRLTRR